MNLQQWEDVTYFLEDLDIDPHCSGGELETVVHVVATALDISSDEAAEVLAEIAQVIQ